MGNKRSFVIISGILVAFLIGVFSANPVVDAASPVVGLLTDATFGLEAIKTAINNIAPVVIPASTQTQIDSIETETGKIQMLKNNQYVPFKQVSNLLTLCDAAGGGSSTATVRVKGTSDTILITGMTLRVDGVDSATDSIKITNYVIDGFSLGTSISNDLTGSTIGVSSSKAMAFDVMGVPLESGGNFPTEIAVVASGLTTTFECDAGGTDDIDIRLVFVSGWKNVDDTVSVTVG